MLGGDDLRATMQVACTAVVAESAPQRKDVVERRLREPEDVGKSLEKALVVAEHGGDLRLLQHDLGEPDAIRIPARLPWQRVAAVGALPLDDALRKRRALDASRPLILQRPHGRQAWSCREETTSVSSNSGKSTSGSWPGIAGSADGGR